MTSWARSKPTRKGVPEVFATVFARKDPLGVTSCAARDDDREKVLSILSTNVWKLNDLQALCPA